MYAVMGVNMSGEIGEILYLCENEPEAEELLAQELETNEEYCVLEVRALV